MAVAIILIFVAIAIGVSIYRERKAVPATESIKAKLSSVLQGFFLHPGHTWVKVTEPSLVAVGADEFTKSVFGSVERITLPEVGSMIQQGGKAWGLKRGRRQLVQTAPISGRVVEINQALYENPEILKDKSPDKNWILKVQPIGLSRQLRNLISGGTLSRWNQAVKEQLASVLGTAEFAVLQDGGELVSDLGDHLTEEQWNKVTREFFATNRN
jgi:glycine cleavage system H lipoate-binding protein